jgi:hypothetical protein
MTAVDPMPEINKEIVERVPGARFIQATIGERDGNYTARLRQCELNLHFNFSVFKKNFSFCNKKNNAKKGFCIFWTIKKELLFFSESQIRNSNGQSLWSDRLLAKTQQRQSHRFVDYGH